MLPLYSARPASLEVLTNWARIDGGAWSLNDRRGELTSGRSISHTSRTLPRTLRTLPEGSEWFLNVSGCSDRSAPSQTRHALHS